MTTPKIAICTLFRDSLADVVRSFQDRRKWDYDKHRIVHICIEGDSVDGTYEALKAIKDLRTIVEKIDTGGPKFGSVAEPDRLRALANLWNRALEIATAEQADYTFILDSDITTQPTLLPQLLKHKVDVIAPMMFFEKSVFFRDTWAYRGADNVPFTNRPPYHTSYTRTGIIRMTSVGMPFMNQRVLFSGVRCTEHEVVGLCDSIRNNGFAIFVDPLAITYHPRNGLEIPPAYEHK